VQKLLLTTKISPLFFFLTYVFFFFFFFCCDFGVGSCGISHVLSPKCQCIIINSPLLEWQGNTHKIIASHSQHKKTENNPTNKIFSFFLVQKIPCEIWKMRSEK
jgi:hypothetical protein